MSPTQNDRNIFPLNLELMKVIAKRWVSENQGVPIEKITLYRYSSILAKTNQHPTKYCIVFDVTGEILPMPENADSHIDKILSGERTIYDFLEYFQTIRNQDSYLSMMDAGFADIYLHKPEENFKDEWMFLTRRLAEDNPGIKIDEPCWVLFDVASTTERPKVRRAMVLEVAKSVKKNYSNLTQKQAAAKINEWLSQNQYTEYSEKHLIRLIKDLGFSPGKPGRKPKK